MSHDYESLHMLFKQRIEMMAYADDKEARTMKSVTLRLPVGHVALIDRLASDLGFSRQAFLDTLLETVLQDSIRAMAAQFSEEKREEIIKELFALYWSRELPEGSVSDE